ncbi:MAG: hypothetical protein HYV27_16435 [Candidatus Hydrogenedentes bacterium]|nr:hypothetical protein [Candidatus Hydrogenedentota bacterium]
MAGPEEQIPEAERLPFICPHCESVIWPRIQYLGMRGTCNKCGGRIALIGLRDAKAPQRAEALPDREESWVMRQAGSPAEEAGERHFDEEAFDATLEEIFNEADHAGQEIHRFAPMLERQATEAQLRGLRELGATESQLNGVANFGDAVKLAEILEPPPSLEELARLRELGASDEEIQQVTTRGEARALMVELQEEDDEGEAAGVPE